MVWTDNQLNQQESSELTYTQTTRPKTKFSLTVFIHHALYTHTHTHQQDPSELTYTQTRLNNTMTVTPFSIFKNQKPM
jgi:hypothetical protein